MDKIIRYKAIARQIIEQQGKFDQESTSEVDTAIITDDQNGHYLLMNLGWHDNHRTYYPYLHLDVRHDKVFVEKNLTEISIAKELEKNGVPPEDIVLAFQAPYKRSYTEYATA